MKKAILSIDVEEWYHLEYLGSCEKDRNQIKMVPAILNLLDLLDEFHIRAVFFILADIAEEYFDILSEIMERGHEVGCHGLNHRLLHDIPTDKFRADAAAAKGKLESLLGSGTVKGYRASCFSMNREKLDILSEIGFLYDSSYIRFLKHPLYGEIDMDGYVKEQSLVYSRNGFYEFEIPTLNILGNNIPISGGGYMRLFPFFLIKMLFRRYWKQNENLLFYIHPFEMTDIKLPFSDGTGFLKKFRASTGRCNNMKKLRKTIMWLKKSGVEFSAPSDFIMNTGVREYAAWEQ